MAFVVISIVGAAIGWIAAEQIYWLAVGAILGAALFASGTLMEYVLAKKLDSSEITFDDRGCFGHMKDRPFNVDYSTLFAFEITKMQVANDVVRPCLYLFPYGAHSKLSDEFWDIESPLERFWYASYSDEVVTLELGESIRERDLEAFLQERTSNA